MASVRHTPLSGAAAAILAAHDAELERMLAGEEPRYPNGAHFIPADIATQDGVADARSRSVTVIIIDEHGNEQWLPGSGRVEDWEWPEY
jgi:hypothetical protein